MSKISLFFIIIGTVILIAGFVPYPQTKYIAETVKVPVIGAIPSSSFSVSPFEKRYYESRLDSGWTVEGSLKISGGSGDIEFYIKDSGGNYVFNPGRVYSGYHFIWNVPKTDYYRIYFDNSFSIITSKAVSWSVEVYYYQTVTKTETDYQYYTWLIFLGAIILGIGIGEARLSSKKV